MLITLVVSLLAASYAAELEKFIFAQSYMGELVKDHSGNDNFAINGDIHSDTNYNMLYAEDRGIYGDGDDRFVKAVPNSYSSADSGVLLLSWTISCLIHSNDASKMTWFSKHSASEERL